MPWSNHEGPDLSLVISGRVLRETGLFKTMGLMESGPDALLGFRLQSSFMMPGTDMVNSGIGWYLLCSENGTEWLLILSLSMPFCKTWVASWFSDRGAFFEKAFWNCWFAISALSLLWVSKFSEFGICRGAMPSESCLEFFLSGRTVS